MFTIAYCFQQLVKIYKILLEILFNNCFNYSREISPIWSRCYSRWHLVFRYINIYEVFFRKIFIRAFLLVRRNRLPFRRPPRLARIHPQPLPPDTVGIRRPDRSCCSQLRWTPFHPFPRRCTSAGTLYAGTLLRIVQRSAWIVPK